MQKPRGILGIAVQCTASVRREKVTEGVSKTLFPTMLCGYGTVKKGGVVWLHFEDLPIFTPDLRKRTK